jgi:alpha-tubulin suppressor-like RCC1 family protein
VLCAVVACAVVAVVLPAGAAADQASEPSLPVAGRLAAGGYHSCVVVGGGSLRCWGLGSSGQLGYGTTSNVGDDETPASVGPVSFGPGVTVKAIAAGQYHTCAILDDGSVRCWGYGGDGRLGYGNTNDVLDPGSVGAVYLGPGRTATAISAGGADTCAILDNGSVLCWGYGGGGFRYDGRLGYGNESNVGDTPSDTPGLVGPVNLEGHRAVAISTGGAHTCAILDDGSVRCWGVGAYGELGYGNTSDVGNSPTNTPNTVGAVNLGPGRTAVAISAGGVSSGPNTAVAGVEHTCAILDNGSVLCWGYGGYGQLGYGNTNHVGDTPATTPGLVGPVNLGGHKAIAISAGQDHTCAILDDHSVRCWGLGVHGRLGYPTLERSGEQPNVGDTPVRTPEKMGPVNLGAGRTAVAISAGGAHTCALLDNGSVRCWGYAAYGQLGYCNTSDVGTDDTPGSVGPVNLEPGDRGTRCAATANPSHLQALRARALRRCLAHAARRPKRQRRRAQSGCLKRYGRTPDPIKLLHARAVSRTQIVLTFAAPGSNGQKPPAARAYLVKQSRHPIRSTRAFLAAQTLCNGYCRFKVTAVGTKIKLTIEHLHPHTTYYYTIAARDNVSARPGPRSRTVEIRTR